jgi:hypothetical protein
VYCFCNAEEMAKLATEMTKRQKIQENLVQVNEKEVSKAREIDEGIRRKMQQSALNREKHQESLGKEVKMLDENWKRKMDEIQRKKREQSKDAIRKAEKIRKEAEQYWEKKKSYTTREQLKEDPVSPTPKPEHTFLNVPTNNYLQAPTPAHYIAPGLSRKEASFDTKTFNTKTFNTIRT